MKKILIIITLLTLVVAGIADQKKRLRKDQNFDNKPRLAGEFLKEEFTVLPGDQLYKAQDLWADLGAKKIKTETPDNPKSKDFLKNISIMDAGDYAEGFKKFVYKAKNETIESINISMDLKKGDYFIDKFVEMEGIYEPKENNNANIEFYGVYYFDDFNINVSELKKEETINITIEKNPNYNKVLLKKYKTAN